jgi:hypothetical protein
MAFIGMRTGWEWLRNVSTTFSVGYDKICQTLPAHKDVLASAVYIPVPFGKPEHIVGAGAGRRVQIDYVLVLV